MSSTWCVVVSILTLSTATAAADDCAKLAAPQDAAIPGPGIAAKISMASCMAESKLNALHLAADDASIAALTDAAKPSIDMLDAAIQAGDPTLTPIAKQARADLFQAMAVRLRASIAPMTMENLAKATADHAFVEPKIKPWLEQAQAK